MTHMEDHDRTIRRRVVDTVRRRDSPAIPRRIVVDTAACRGSPAIRRIEADTAARQGTVRPALRATAGRLLMVRRPRIVIQAPPTPRPRMGEAEPAWAVARPIAVHLPMEAVAVHAGVEVAVVHTTVVEAVEVAAHRRVEVTVADGGNAVASRYSLASQLSS